MTALAVLLAGLAVLVWPGRRGSRAVRSRLAGARESPGHTSSWGLKPRRAPLPLRRAFPHQRVEAGQWLPLLDELAAALRSGLTPIDALEMAVSSSSPSVRAALAPVLQAAREGRAAGPAWARAARVRSSPELGLLARSWAISEELGAPLADGVDSAARALRSGRDISSRLATATAGARATANILTALPLAGVGVGLLMGIGPAQLYGSAAALVSLACGLLLIAVGRLFVARMITHVTMR